MSVGGGSNQSQTKSASGTQADSSSWMNNISNAYNSASSFVDPVQQAYLSNLYGLAQGAANPGATTAAAHQGQQAVLPGMQQGFNNMTGLTDSSGQIAAQEASLKSGLGSLFRDELMPAVQSNAIGAGGFGGGRQGVAEGQAVGQIADSYTAGLGDITARANQTATAAGSLLPQMGQSIQSAFTAPSMAGLDPLARLAQILGGPTVLSSSQGGSGSSGSSGSTSTQHSGSASKSDSSGWNFNFGLF